MAKKKTKTRRRGGRARRRNLMGSVSEGAVAAGIGAGGYYLQKLASQNVEFLRENWWAGAAATFGISAILGTRRGRLPQKLSSALAATAGYSAVMAYDLQAAGDTGAVFAPQYRELPAPMPVPQMPQLPAPVEAAAVYPPTGPYNHFARASGGVAYGRV